MLLPEASRHALAEAARVAACDLIRYGDRTGDMEDYIVEVADDLIVAAMLDTLPPGLTIAEV